MRSAIQDVIENSASIVDREADDLAAWINELIGDLGGGEHHTESHYNLLAMGIQRLYDKLRSHPGYLKALQEVTHQLLSNHQTWGRKSLIDTSRLQIDLICLPRLSRIPLHDHPQTWGAQMVISGQTRIQQYQFVRELEQQHNLICLERLMNKVLMLHEFSTFTPTYQNLHELQAISSHSVILSMKINANKTRNKSLYYQVPSTQQGNKALYNRIRKRESQRTVSVE